MSMEDVYPIQVTRVKATLLRCDNRLILIDAGRNAEDAETILNYARTELNMPLEKHGEVCIITHIHRDHIGGLGRLMENCNLKIASHVHEAADIESATGFKVDLQLKDREALPYCGGIQFIHVPGHTAGNLCLYLPEKELLIVGDTIFADEEGNLTPPPDQYCTDPEMAKRELKRLQELEFDNIVLSHGKDTIKGAKKKFEHMMQRLTQ